MYLNEKQMVTNAPTLNVVCVHVFVDVQRVSEDGVPS